MLTLSSALSNSVSGSFINTTKKILINNAAADVAPTVSIATATGGANEGAEASVGFNVTLDAAAGKDMYVKYVLSTTDGDYTNDKAEESEDFSLPDALADRVFLIPAYATTLASDKTITLINDAVYEYTEDIVINLATYTDDDAATLTVNDLSKTFTYTITEGDDPPILEFSDSDRAVEFAESSTNRSIEIQFKSSGTQEAEMKVYGYVSISTDASKTTAANGTDICEGTACSGANPHWENYEKMTISAGTTSETKSFKIEPDDRYEEAQIATFVLQAFTAAEAGGIYYNSGYTTGDAGSGLASASNATTDGDEELVLTITASGDDERPVVEWVDNSTGTDNLPWSIPGGSYPISRNVEENDPDGDGSDGGTAYFTLQLSKFSEKAITVNYTLLTTETTTENMAILAQKKCMIFTALGIFNF